MRAIFISYRRDDTEGHAGRLYDDLAKRFGENCVFMDVTGIEPGVDFRKVINHRVASCGVLLAVIGTAWIDATDEQGLRRLEDPVDFVRLEIASALKRDIAVIPVLVHGARMPRAEQLPDDMKELAYRNALELTHPRWDSDVEILIKVLNRHFDDDGDKPVAGSSSTSPEGPECAAPQRRPEIHWQYSPAAAPNPPEAAAPLETPRDGAKPRNGELRRIPIWAGIAAALLLGLVLYLGGKAMLGGSSKPIIREFSASPLQVTRGDAVTLHWDVVSADDVEMTPFGKLSPSGNITDYPLQTTTYALSATGRSGGAAGASKKVMVNQPQAQPAATLNNSIPNFAGAWQLFEFTLNGRQQSISPKTPLLTITQKESLVRIGNRELSINSEGNVTYQLFSIFANGQWQPSFAQEKADGVITVTWRLEGAILISETTYHDKTTYGHPVYKGQQIGKYRRVSPAAAASKEPPWQNSLGMKFVPAPGTQVLFSIWDTRVADFRTYVRDSGYQQKGGVQVTKVVKVDDPSIHSGFDIRPALDENASWEQPGFRQGADYPVVDVSWVEAKAFCVWLTKKERASGLITPDQFYRLPTDAEWTVAVGSGKYPWGDNWPPPKGSGNYADDAFVASLPGGGWSQVPGNDGYARTSPVGSFSENQYGLYDMGGNVWQWCEDWSDSSHSFRVLRGGSWAEYTPEALSSSSHRAVPPDSRIDRRGFRCVLASGPAR